MATLMQGTALEQRAMSSRVEAAGRELARYGMVVVVGWIGLMKFTAYEAEGIRPFVANSPLMSWVYGPMSVRFPALSAIPGQFLVKDLALLGISLWSLGEAWQASQRRG